MLGSRFSLLLMREVRRVGSNKNIPLGARVISATNRLLFRRDEGSLRPDLYYRLAGFTIHLPPLRDRIDDIATLAQSFARAFAERHHLHNLLLTRDALATLCAHPWPGNVRELRSVVEQSAILASGGEIGPSQISTVLGHSTRTSTAPPPAPPPPPAAAQLPPRDVASGGLRDVERSLIVQAFQTAHGNVTTAAKALGIPRTTLRAKLRRWGLM
jgi:DNA-binding NtrC family response regulator